ncbi:MAG: hypothetical protein WAL47_17535 [Pyrinomonadaceae bacterium]
MPFSVARSTLTIAGCGNFAMSPEVERLHVAARRYCADRFGVWAEMYKRLAEAGGNRRGQGYTPEAYRTFPRYQVLDAIRTDLERLTGTDVGSLDDARDLFALAGLTAENAFTTYDDPEAQSAVVEEREAFARFVREMPATALSAVESLPFTRVLPHEEAEQVWDSVERSWGLTRRQYWYPLAETERADVEAFQAPYLQRALTAERLGTILAERGVTRVWELREYGPEYELDASAFEPHYNGAERFWTSPALDWIVYASHETSITVGGWVLDEVKRAWPEWGRHIWTTPFFE